jgi:hypothetical protein
MAKFLFLLSPNGVHLTSDVLTWEIVTVDGVWISDWIYWTFLTTCDCILHANLRLPLVSTAISSLSLFSRGFRIPTVDVPFLLVYRIIPILQQHLLQQPRTFYRSLQHTPNLAQGSRLNNWNSYEPWLIKFGKEPLWNASSVTVSSICGRHISLRSRCSVMAVIY